jgi:hypothetical protein
VVHVTFGSAWTAFVQEEEIPGEAAVEGERRMVARLRRAGERNMLSVVVKKCSFGPMRILKIYMPREMGKWR